jgi:carbonic anhydrase/acetyltransferase-like protein (isoleucine patch superfamily)
MEFEGIWPTIGAGAFIAPNAVVIGDVVVGPKANIWFNCVVRGDDHYIRIGAETNIQDGTIIHVSKGTHPTVIGDGVTVGHGCILHGCTIQDRCMIGIGAIVLDGAVVEEGAVVAAGAVVSPGKRVAKGEMWAGCPAKLLRPVKPGELDFIKANGPHYMGLAGAYLRMRDAAERQR